MARSESKCEKQDCLQRKSHQQFLLHPFVSVLRQLSTSRQEALTWTLSLHLFFSFFYYFTRKPHMLQTVIENSIEQEDAVCALSGDALVPVSPAKGPGGLREMCEQGQARSL